MKRLHRRDQFLNSYYRWQSEAWDGINEKASKMYNKAYALLQKHFPVHRHNYKDGVCQGEGTCQYEWRVEDNPERLKLYRRD